MTGAESNGAGPIRRRGLTPEQEERRRVVEERTRLMSERGVPQPKSGIFGGKPKAPKK